MPISNYTKKKVPKTLKIVEKPKPKAKPEPKKKLKPKTLKIVEKKPDKAMAPKKKVPKTLRIKTTTVPTTVARPTPVAKPEPFVYPDDYGDYVEEFTVGAGAGAGAFGGAGAGAGSPAGGSPINKQTIVERINAIVRIGTPGARFDSKNMNSLGNEFMKVLFNKNKLSKKIKYHTYDWDSNLPKHADLFRSKLERLEQVMGDAGIRYASGSYEGGDVNRLPWILKRSGLRR